MMNSNIEKQYKKLMISYIAKLEICPEQRAALFFDFYENGDTYYDDVCDILYCASVGELNAPLWLSPNGEIYACSQHRSSSHMFLMDGSDFPSFKGDLLEHLELLFTKIYSLTCVGHRVPLCNFA